MYIDEMHSHFVIDNRWIIEYVIHFFLNQRPEIKAAFHKSMFSLP